MKQTTLAMLTALALVATLAISCRRLPPRPDDLPELYPVEIVATFGGAPVEGTIVNLTPTDPALKKWKSGGRTDATGRATIRTGMFFDGAPSGEFRLSFQNMRERVGDTLEDMQPLSLIPLKYGPLRTDLTVEIKPSKKKTELFFELDGGEEIVPPPKGATLGPPKRSVAPR